MKKGEIWNDIEDGSKVKINFIKYVEYTRQDLIYLESYPDGYDGFVMGREDFLQQYEKTC